MAVHKHALGDFISVVFHQRAFDDVVDFPEIESGFHGRGRFFLELFAYLLGDDLDPVSIFISEYFFFVLGH